MANEIVVQFAVLSVFAVALLCLITVHLRRKALRSQPQRVLQMPVIVEKVEAKELATESQPPQTITIELESENTVVAVSPEPAVTPAAVPSSRPAELASEATPIAEEQNPNQLILAGISENIRRSLIKPVPTYSPLQFQEKQRDTEYVRIKKKIITPHGQVRFSILKDSLSSNMLAVFRRACLDWKSPDDLISFLPPYLEPEAEIRNGRLLLIGTPGHNEKLAIPIRSFDADASFLECFDFVSDERSATNTPAVVLTNEDVLEVVSRGVITQPVFMEPAERIHAAG